MAYLQGFVYAVTSSFREGNGFESQRRIFEVAVFIGGVESMKKVNMWSLFVGLDDD